MQLLHYTLALEVAKQYRAEMINVAERRKQARAGFDTETDSDTGTGTDAEELSRRAALTRQRNLT